MSTERTCPRSGTGAGRAESRASRSRGGASGTEGERHDLLSGMADAVHIDLPSRLVVGTAPKSPFRQAFGSLVGHPLVPPEEANQILLWWRRRGIEPLVQRKTHPDVYKLIRRLCLARRTSADGVTDGPAD